MIETSSILNLNEKYSENILINLNENSIDDINHIKNKVKNLYKIIEDLETDIVNIKQYYHKKELEIYTQFDSKINKWIYRYLELKLQIQNEKNIYEDNKKIWQYDFRNLCNLIQNLLKKIKQKDEDYLVIFKELERELNNLIEASKEKNHVKHNLSNRTNGSNKTTNPDSNNNIIDGSSCSTMNKENKIDETLKKQKKATINQDILDENITKTLSENDLYNIDISSNNLNNKLPIKIDEKSFTSQNQSDSDQVTFNYFLSPRNMLNLVANPKKLLDITKEEHLEKPSQKLSKLGNALLKSRTTAEIAKTTKNSGLKLLHGIQQKLRKYIFDTNEKMANQQIEFGEETNNTLKRVQTLIQTNINTNIEIKTNNNDEDNLTLAELTTRKDYIPSNILDSLQKGSKLHEKANTGNNLELKLDNKIIDKEEQNLNLMLTMLLKKNPGSMQKIDINRLFYDIQNSLSFSEREAMLCALLNVKENTLTCKSEIKLQDLLGISQAENICSLGNLIPSINQSLKRTGSQTNYNFELGKNNDNDIKFDLEDKINRKYSLHIDDNSNLQENTYNNNCRILNTSLLNSNYNNSKISRVDLNNKDIKFSTPTNLQKSSQKLFLNAFRSGKLHNINDLKKQEYTYIFENISPIKQNNSIFIEKVSKNLDFDKALSPKNNTLVQTKYKNGSNNTTVQLMTDISAPILKEMPQEKENIIPSINNMNINLANQLNKPIKIMNNNSNNQPNKSNKKSKSNNKKKNTVCFWLCNKK